MRKKWIDFILIVSLISFSPIAAVVAGPVKPKAEKNKFPINLVFNPAEKKARVLNFDKNFSLGQLFFGAAPDLATEFMQRKAAQGLVTVPAGKYVLFAPSRRFYANPASIKALPADSFDCLALSSASMDDAEDGLCDRALGSIGNLKGIIYLNLDRSDASDKGAAHAAGIRDLQRLTALGTMIEGKCFKDFSKLARLHSLGFSNSPIKDENLVYLSAIKNLDYLNLSSTPITNIGIKNLSGCQHLIELDLLNDHALTDACVPSLLALKELRSLVLAGTSVSSKGVLQLKTSSLSRLVLPEKSYSSAMLQKIQRAFPNTKIVIPASSERALSAENKVIFAPLH